MNPWIFWCFLDSAVFAVMRHFFISSSGRCGLSNALCQASLMFAELLSAPELMYTCVWPRVTLCSSSLQTLDINFTHTGCVYIHTYNAIKAVLQWSLCKPNTVTVLMWFMLIIRVITCALNAFLSLWHRHACACLCFHKMMSAIN